MSKKTNSKKIQVVLTEDQQKGLADIMREDLQSNVSAYIGLLIGLEVARRLKRVGRPRKDIETGEDDDINLDGDKDYSDDLPKNHIYMGQYIGDRELADIKERHKFLK